MKSILIVSGINLFPTISGSKRRILNLINNFRTQGVEVSYLWVALGSKENIMPMKRLFGKGLFVYNQAKHKINPRILFCGYLRKTLKFLRLDKKIIIKYWADDLYPAGLAEYVSALAKKIHVDAVMCEYLFYSPIFLQLPDHVVKIIDTHDKMADRHKLFLDPHSSLPFFYISEKEEKRALERADVIIAIQKEEEHYFRRLTNAQKRVFTIGDSIETAEPYFVKNKNISFLGSSYRMNVLACEWFIQKILPTILRLDPEIQFLIAGTVCKEIPDSSRYKKLGVVADVEEIYQISRVIVNPTTQGTGLNIKTIEALAYAKPLVTTPKGARGILAQKGALIVAKNEQDFAKQVVEIVNNDEAAMRLSVEAVRFVAHYNEGNINTLKELISIEK
ncbi:MAG: glycosyltransferase [Lachnospiraceae bacterium]|nr:glycosyltransferase [Lachnospiraceae bacterium]